MTVLCCARGGGDTRLSRMLPGLSAHYGALRRSRRGACRRCPAPMCRLPQEAASLYPASPGAAQAFSLRMSSGGER